MGWLGSFFSNMADAFATGGNAQAFKARRDERLQQQGQDGATARGEQILGQYAVAAYERSKAKQREVGPWEDQYVNDDVRIQVKSGYSRDSDAWTTEITVSPRQNNPCGSHQHVVFDENGREIFNEWREK